MNVYRHELKMVGKTTILWTVSLAAITSMFMLLYPAFSQESEEFLKLLEGFPEGILKGLGISENFFTIIGFYSYIFIYVALCGAIQAMNLGLSLVSKETNDKTADFLLTKPITRTSILTSKLMAALTAILFTNVIYVAVSFGIASLVKTDAFSVEHFLLISLSLFFLQCIMLSFGLVLSILTRIKSIIGVSLGIVFAFFALSMFGSILGKEVFSWFTPFKYFEAQTIVKNGAYEGKFIILSIVIVVVSLVTSYIVYNKKDIQAV
ncbi:MAG: ABC transporter permease subunit [Bacillaceae bacterium]